MATYDTVNLDTEARTPSKKSGTPRIELTEALGLEEMRANVWFLSPGDAMSRHHHGTQEELYVQLRGPGRLWIDGDLLDVPEGTVVRVPPETERQVLNDTEGEHVWLIVGVPPVAGDGVVQEG